MVDHAQLTAIDDAASYAISALQSLQQLVAAIGQDTSNVDAAISAVSAAQQNVRAYMDQHPDPEPGDPGQPADPYDPGY